MSAYNITLDFFVFLASLAILWRCESIINLTVKPPKVKGTSHRWLMVSRIAIWLIAAGSLLTLYKLLILKHEYSLPTSVLIFGVAIYMVNERRVSHITNGSHGRRSSDRALQGCEE